MFEFLNDPMMAAKARRDILNLSPGTQIPGYTGHRTGVRLGFGKTFGHQTSISYMDRSQLNENNEVEETIDYIDNYDDMIDRVIRLSLDDRRRRFRTPDPKNDSTAVGELLRGCHPMPPIFANFYRHNQNRYNRLPTNSSKMISPTFETDMIDFRPEAESESECELIDAKINRPKLIQIDDDNRVTEKLRLYKAWDARRRQHQLNNEKQLINSNIIID